MTHAPSSNVTPATPTTGVAGTASPVPVKGGSKKTLKGTGCRGGSKKSRKIPGAAKSWVKFVMEVFNKNRAKNPKYKYGQAMKDAAKLKKKNKTLKKGGEGESEGEVEVKPEETA
jgi:hypothetical protein